MRDLRTITALVDGDPLYRIEIPGEVARFLPAGAVAYVARGGLRLIASYEDYLEGRFGQLLHVSFSRPNILPNWRDVRLVKDTFYGDEAEAMLVLPKARDYTNLHIYTHHLWQMPEPWTDAGATYATIEHRREAVHQAPGRPPGEPAGAGAGPDGDAAQPSEPVHAPGAAVGAVHAPADVGGVA